MRLDQRRLDGRVVTTPALEQAGRTGVNSRQRFRLSCGAQRSGSLVEGWSSDDDVSLRSDLQWDTRLTLESGAVTAGLLGRAVISSDATAPRRSSSPATTAPAARKTAA